MGLGTQNEGEGVSQEDTSGEHSRQRTEQRSCGESMPGVSSVAGRARECMGGQAGHRAQGPPEGLRCRAHCEAFTPHEVRSGYGFRALKGPQASGHAEKTVGKGRARRPGRLLRP